MKIIIDENNEQIVVNLNPLVSSVIMKFDSKKAFANSDNTRHILFKAINTAINILHRRVNEKVDEEYHKIFKREIKAIEIKD